MRRERHNDEKESKGKVMNDKQAIEVLMDLQSQMPKGSWSYAALQVAIEALKERKRG